MVNNMEEDQILSEYLNSEEMEKLVKSLEVYLANIQNRVEKIRLAPIVTYNLKELEQYLPYISSYYAGFEELLAKVLALLKLLETREDDPDIRKLIQQLIPQIEEYKEAAEKYPEYYYYYYKKYPAYQYNIPYTKREKYLQSIQKARELVRKYEAEQHRIDALDFLKYQLALESGVPEEELFREPMSLDEAIISACDRIKEELNREAEWHEQRAKLEAKLVELSNEKQKLEQLKKELLYKAIDQFIQEEKTRMESG